MSISKRNLETKNLASYSHPLTDMFEQPQSPEEWIQYALSDDQVNFYKENGYLSGVKVLTNEQADILNGELASLPEMSEDRKKLFYQYNSNESEDPNKVLFHAIGGWRSMVGFHDLLWAPAYRMAAFQLMGGSVRLFHDQLFCKPARHGGVVAWHQDFSYWTFTRPMNHLTCWIGLDDANHENGCLYYIPGSHKWGLLPITGLAGNMEAVREVLDETQLKQFENKKANELAKGYASFHHPQMMHGSYANTSDRSRRAVVINAMGPNTISNVDQFDRMEDLRDFPALGKDGEKLGEPNFPLLFDIDLELQDKKHKVPMIK